MSPRFRPAIGAYRDQKSGAIRGRLTGRSAAGREARPTLVWFERRVGKG
jgi:hypothetical protein